MATTSPDGIGYITTADNVTPSVESSAQATTIQTAFNFRQRYEFVWANAAARTGQTGMTNGSSGYQVDTKSEYIYDIGAWRLRTPYAEYAATVQSIPNGTNTAVSNFSLVSANTTDSTFTSVTTNAITLVQPGVYSLSLTVGIVASGTGGTVAFSSNVGGTAVISVSSFVSFAGVPITTCVVPFYRTAAANSVIYMFIAQNSGSSQNTTTPLPTLRIGRLG